VSQSPASADELHAARNADSPYRQNLRHVNELIKQGASLSGHERNCAFLNLGGESFATISAVSGIDFADDGRGLATTDFDGDGDVDVWLTNRTAPRVRFLRNQSPAGNAFLLLKLQGTTCNRDAIGARVAVHLSGATQPLIKTVRAGEGYLSQSSKWLHFGLGRSGASIESVRVQWPGGAWETFENFQPNHHYVLVQGSASPRRLPQRPKASALKPSRQPVPTATHVQRVPLTTPIPAPRLPYASAEDDVQLDALLTSPHQPVLVVLWASWCGTCLEELAALAADAANIDAAELTVLALNADDQFAESGATVDANTVLRQIGWPDGDPNLRFGQATNELVKRLQALHDFPFRREMDMAVPISLLFDEHGKLAVIYRGRTSTEDVLADMDRFKLEPAVWQESSLPLAGRFNEHPPDPDFNPILQDLLDREQAIDALGYLQRFESDFTDNESLANLRGVLADQLLQLDRPADALAQYRAAANALPDEAIINNLAWLLATHSDDAIRDGAEAVKWAEAAAKATQFQNPGVLDTLAASYAEAGNFDQASQTITRAITLATAERNMTLVQRLQRRAALYGQGKPFRQE